MSLQNNIRHVERHHKPDDCDAYIEMVAWSDVLEAVKKLKKKLDWYKEHDTGFPYFKISKHIDEAFGGGLSESVLSELCEDDDKG